MRRVENGFADYVSVAVCLKDSDNVVVAGQSPLGEISARVSMVGGNQGVRRVTERAVINDVMIAGRVQQTCTGQCHKLIIRNSRAMMGWTSVQPVMGDRSIREQCSQSLGNCDIEKVSLQITITFNGQASLDSIFTSQRHSNLWQIASFSHQFN